MIASLALFVIATTDKVVVAVVIVYIGITTCSLSNTYHSSKLLGSLQDCPPVPYPFSVKRVSSFDGTLFLLSQLQAH